MEKYPFSSDDGSSYLSLGNTVIMIHIKLESSWWELTSSKNGSSFVLNSLPFYFRGFQMDELENTLEEIMDAFLNQNKQVALQKLQNFAVSVAMDFKFCESVCQAKILLPENNEAD